MSKSIFITGASGFLGAYIVKELVQKNYRVVALRRQPRLPFYIPSGIWEKVEWVDGDLFDLPQLEAGMKGADAVIHAAAKVSFHPGDRKELYRTNVEGTANVVNMALETGVPRLLHVSSVAAIGRDAAGGTIHEDQKWDPERKTTHYAQSKYRSELEVWRGMAEGLSAVIINPSTILGYGDWDHSSCRIFKTAYQEFPWYTTGINGFVDVEDVAKAGILLLESPIESERYIINGENWGFRDLFNTIADAFEKKRPYRLATPFWSGLAWKLEYLKYLLSGEKPLLTRESARVANSRTYFSNEKLIQAIPGFSFTPLQTTLIRACRQYLQAAKGTKE